MSQDRTALIEELKVLQQELEQMGNEFNQDGVIDAQEKEMLDLMLKEINVVKGEVEELTRSHQSNNNVPPQPPTPQAPTVNTSNIPTVEILSTAGNVGNAETTASVSINGDGAALDINAVDGNTSTTAHIDSQGRVKVTQTEDLGNGASLELALNNNGITVGFTKKYPSLVNFVSKELTLASFYAAIDLNTVVTFKLDAEINATERLTTEKVGFGVSGSLKASGRIELYFQLLQSFDIGVKPGLDLTVSSSGELYAVPESREVILELNGAEIKLNAAAEVFIRASRDIQNIYKELGGDPQDLVFETSLGSLELLIINTPKYKSTLNSPQAPQLTGFEFKPGKDFQKVVDAGQELSEKAQFLVDALKKVAEFVGDVCSDAADFASKCLDKIGDTYDDLTMTDEEKRKLATQAQFQQICGRTAQKLAKQKEHVQAIATLNSRMDKLLYFLDLVSKEIYKDQFIKETLQALRSGDSDTLESNDRISSTGIVIKRVDIGGDEIGNAYIQGKSIRVETILDVESQDAFRRFSNEQTIEATLEVEIKCNNNVVANKQKVISFCINGITGGHLTLELPTDQPDSTSVQWEVCTTINFSGEIYDVSKTVQIDVTKEPRAPERPDTSTIMISDLEMLPPSQPMKQGAQAKITARFNADKGMNPNENAVIVALLHYDNERADYGGGETTFKIKEGINEININIDIALIEDDVMDQSKYKIALNLDGERLLHQQSVDKAVIVTQG